MHKTEIVNSTLAYIEAQLQSGVATLTLDDVANKIGYSKFYLNRIFQQQTGATIHRYVLERRLTLAAEKLVYTSRPIADIAYEAGYHSQQAFTNVFSSVYLCSPMRYRAAGQFTPFRKAYTAKAATGLYAGGRLGVAA